MHQELFDNLAEARDQNAWLVNYSKDDKKSNVIVFADSKAAAENEFTRLASSEASLNNVTEY